MPHKQFKMLDIHAVRVGRLNEQDVKTLGRLTRFYTSCVSYTILILSTNSLEIVKFVINQFSLLTRFTSKISFINLYHVAIILDSFPHGYQLRVIGLPITVLGMLLSMFLSPQR